jgi:hypothetical protein
MPDDRDGYEAYYAEKLWNLIPVAYRAEDSLELDGRGPLREMVNRIGAQAATVRRSIDRMWEDQSIETCDDWIIPYMADLLATNLVASLDARGQRLDVAKTIYYRRRKGTVAMLEELASDVTGWNARVVEFFRRLSRTWHGLDPELGWPADRPDPEGTRALQRAQGLIGALTHTPRGGLADLRDDYGATQAHSAFDEFFHTADFRRGRGRVGWHNIPRLGVFLWRLRSFPADLTTPIRDQNCPNQYTFDPTGRDVPLFAAATRAYGDAWVSPQEWQLPNAIDQRLLQAELLDLYAALDPQDGVSLLSRSLGIFRPGGLSWNLVPMSQVTADAQQLGTAQPYLIVPERGRLIVHNPPPVEATTLFYRLTYHYGFSSTIGAGNYDRRLLGQQSLTGATVQGGGNALDLALAVFPPTGTQTTGTVVITDSLTYDGVRDVEDIEALTLGAENRRRPLIRLPAPGGGPGVTEWVFTAASTDPDVGQLVLEGLFVSGGDIVLRGDFTSVRLTCCTLDPGTFDNDTATYALAADGRELQPCRLWVEGQVRELTIDRCIVGPIQSRATPGEVGAQPGSIETLQISDSIVQGLQPEATLRLSSGQVDLNRCTILGRAEVHRLYASECILDDVVLVEDQQYGCVRFSAWATGSVLPRQYESVTIAARSPLFTSRAFGQPGYGQLLSGVDAAIVAGAQNGSEMGAFARDKNSIKERSLYIKYEEFMPLGLIPVLIYMT